MPTTDTDADTWAIFTATIDRVALTQEFFGTPADRAMRAAHAERVHRFYGRAQHRDLTALIAEATEWNHRDAIRRRAASLSAYHPRTTTRKAA